MSQRIGIRPLRADEQKCRGWSVEVDGRRLENVGTLRIHNPRFGTLVYGAAPRGYDTWNFHELGGGGAVTIPFTELGGELFIGVVEQDRPTQGGSVLNVPRGFLDFGETHLVAGKRELGEETGLTVLTGTILELPGKPANPNSAFFDTSLEGEGVKFFAVEVPPEDLSQLPEGGFALRSADSDQPSGVSHRLAEHIGHLRFIHWTEASQLGDMFSIAGVARLLAYLHSLAPGTR